MPRGCASFRNAMTRRRFFQVGGAGLFGLTLADLFRAHAAPKRSAPAKQVIFVFLAGGPPHQETFDMKPDQPVDIRGPFKPVPTAVPGLEICERLPRLARVANKYSVLRSVHSYGYPLAGDHFAGLIWKTGNPRGIRGTPKFPTYGNVAARLCPAPADLPPFVAMGDLAQMAPGLRENYLGPACDPLYVELPEGRAANPLTDMLVLPTIDVPDFDRRARLLQALDAQLRRQDAADPVIAGLDRFQQKAFDLLRSPRLREALDLRREPDKSLGRYGASILHYARGNHSRKLLAARRLIEAGVPFVYVDLPYWDWHGGSVKNPENTPELNLAALDAGLSSLLEDLDDRGLLETTIVVALGEMGRTPKARDTKSFGRDHWAHAQFVLVAGGGFKAGQVVGATDRQAAYVKDKEYRVASLGKTLYHLLGLDPDHELMTPDDRPLKLITEDVPLIKEALA